MKTCTKCGIEKDNSEFYINCNRCKDCYKTAVAKYQASPKGKAVQAKSNASPERKAAKAIYNASPEGKATQSIYSARPEVKAAMTIYQNSPEGKAVKAIYAASPERKAVKATYEASPEGKTARAKRFAKRYQTDPLFKASHNFKSSFKDACKANGFSKSGKPTFSQLGIPGILWYTYEYYKNHMEKLFLVPGNEWMNWLNQGQHRTSGPNKYDPHNKLTWRWNLDHKIPQSKLPWKTTDDTNFKQCWDLSNLQPMLAETNLKKGNKTA